MRDLKGMEPLTQKGPSCGTTSLAMVIRFLTQDRSIAPEDIDREIRRLPRMFSAPVDLVEYARNRGLQAEEYNHGSLQQIEELVSQGIPVIPLLDLTPDNALDFDHWHWVVVVAVERAAGRQLLFINNPWGRREEWEQERFMTEWTRLRLLGLAFGYSNYFIAVGTPDDSLPPRRAEGVGPANAVTKGLADVLNGFAAMRSGSTFKGLGQVLRGVLRSPCGALCIVADNIRRQVKSVLKR